MADNYLEKRYEEVFGKSAESKAVTPKTASLTTLLRRNRSVRGYRKDYVVHMRQLETIIGVNPLVASSKNWQALRFRPVTKGADADLILKNIRLGALLPELHLPTPGTEPEAFIVVCSTVDDCPSLFIDLGISLQSMLLKATEIGLNGIIIRAFNKEAIKKGLNLPLDPVAVVAVGKSAEKFELREVNAGSSLNYFRENGVHVVPKLRTEDIII